jgi:SRSO17 transposase
MAAGLSVDLDGWRREFDELMLRVGGRFARVEPRRRMAAFVRALLAGLPRVNCWPIAEHAGEHGPRGMQRLLSAAVWDETGVRDDLRGYVLEHFADPGAVLVVDETGRSREGHHDGGHPAAVHRHGRADRERPGRRLPGLCRPGWVRVHRPGLVPAPVLDV